MAVGRGEPDTIAPLDVRVREIEVPGKHPRVVGCDRCLHVDPSQRPPPLVHRQPRARPPPELSESIRYLRRAQSSDVAQEPLQQLPRHLPALRCASLRFLQQRIGIDAVGVELVAVDAHPIVHDRGRHLRVELEAQAASGDECLRADVGLGDQGRSRWEGEHIEVPLEPWSLRHQLRLVAAYRQPTDLRSGASEHLAAEHPRQHLAAEAETEHGDVGIDGPTHETRFARHERLRVVERRTLGAERNDEVVPGRVDLAVVDVDPERLDDRRVVIQPLGDESWGGGLLVLDDQRSQSRRCLARGTHREPPMVDLADSSDSTSCATWRTASANRETISASSSSVVVKAGANSDWSPA